MWTGGLALAVAVALCLARTFAPLPIQASIHHEPVVSSRAAEALGLRLEDRAANPARPQAGRVVVREVKPGSPAALAGVRAGDVVVFVEDQLVSSAQRFFQILEALPPQSPVTLELVRSGRYLVLTATAPR